MQKVKDPLESVRKWPAKCENRECFLPHKFPVIRYISQTVIKSMANFTSYNYVAILIPVNCLFGQEDEEM